MKRIVNINRHIIHNNKQHGERTPPISVKTAGRNVYGDTVDILDKEGNTVARIMYRPDQPLKCGATAWIEVTTECVVRQKELFTVV